MKKKRPINSKNGFGLLEAVVGVSIISLSLAALMTVSQLSHKIVGESLRSVQASFLAEEGAEAIKSLRSVGWQSRIMPLADGADYYLNFNGAAWEATTTNSYVDGIFERKFSVYGVYRDASGDIAASGSLDNGTKKVTVSVSWAGRNGTTTKSLTTYVTDIFSN